MTHDPLYPLSVLSDFSRESYAKGRADALAEARAAVAARRDQGYPGINDALAAIDALRGETE